jgi:tetratricopeptide (TPR) repeat protein
VTTELRYMPCAEFETSVHSYVDGELARTDSRALLVHLELCEGCRGTIDVLREQIRVHQSAFDLERVMVDFDKDGFFARLSDRLATSNTSRLSSLLYELGKAYFVAGNDAKLTMFLHRKAVSIERASAEGRRLVKETVELGARGAGSDRRRAAALKRSSQLFRGRESSRKGARLGVRSGRTPLDNARRFLEECLILDPKNAAARLYLGVYFVRCDRPTEAIAEYEKILALPGLDRMTRVMTLQALGNAHGYLCAYDKAVAAFEEIRRIGQVEDDPKFFTIHLSLAMFYAKLGKLDRSTELFGELVTRFPDRTAEARAVLAKAEVFRGLLVSRPRFRDRLSKRYPALFAG